jgi:hypothetical protein
VWASGTPFSLRQIFCRRQATFCLAQGVKEYDGPWRGSLTPPVRRNQRRAAFDQFVAETTGSLLRTAYLVTGDAGHAEDLVQESLFKIARRWSRVVSMDIPQTQAEDLQLLSALLPSWRCLPVLVRPYLHGGNITSAPVRCSAHAGPGQGLIFGPGQALLLRSARPKPVLPLPKA